MPQRPLALVTRPNPGAMTLADRLKRKGYDSLIDPMISIRACKGLTLLPVPFNFDAVLFTSGNAIRHLPEGKILSATPAFAVGSMTANLAREAGFRHVIEGGGTAHALAETVMSAIPKHGAKAPRLLLPTAAHAGHALTERLESAGFSVMRWHVYAATPARRLAPATRTAFAQDRVECVLLLSSYTARTFSRLICGAGLAENLSHVRALCLSTAIAAAAETLRWRRILTAKTPDLDSLVACL